MAKLFVAGFGVDSVDCRNIGRSRHIVDNRVKKQLNALVFVRCSASDRNHQVRQCRFADALLDFVNRQFLAFEILRQKVVILLRDMLDELSAVFFGQFPHIFGYVFNGSLNAHFVAVDGSLHADQINDASEIRLGADGKLNRNGVAFQPVLHYIHNIVKIRSRDVHFIDIRHSGNIVFVGLPPDGFGLGLDAPLGAKHRNRTVKNTQRPLDFHGKIDMTRGVDDVNAVFFPKTSRSRGGNGNASFLLLVHPIHDGSAVVHLADLMRLTAIEKDTLGRGCLAGVNVCHYSDVSGPFKRNLPRHKYLRKNSTGTAAASAAYHLK